MLTVKTPDLYLNKPNVLAESGSFVRNVGKNPLIIAGKNALESVKTDFFKSLKENGISTENVHIFSGFPSNNQFNSYAEDARSFNADFIIGIGGGKVLDTAKTTADILSIPVVSVPTVAATCASWAALSIEYDDKGSYVRVRTNKKCPVLILADTKVLFNSPRRYLFSGIVDTFAKYYEVRPTLEVHPKDEATDIGFHASFLAFENLQKYTFKAIQKAEQGIFDEEAIHVIDAIIYLAGFAGSFTSGYDHYSFAHPFYHTSTRLLHTNIKLHGEKVAFGIISQLVLEGKDDEEILKTIALFSKFKNDFTLEDFAIKDSLEKDLSYLGKAIPELFPYVPYSEEKIIYALKKADELTKQFRRG